MDFVSSPIITVVLNLIATTLVSKGILDNGSKQMFIQMADNIIASLTTIIVGVYSIYKMVDLHKHKLTIMSGGTTTVISGPAKPAEPITPPVTQPASQTPTTPIHQGLPATPNP